MAVVNRTMARLYWPGDSAVGQCLQIGRDEPPCTRVVGVAANTPRQAIVEGDSLLYYIPKEQADADLRTGGRLLIRLSDGGAETVEGVSAAVRREALALDPSLRYVSARSLDDLISPQLGPWRLGAALFGTFGVLALVIASVGLYSVVVFDVEGRRREMGIRAALGATAASLLGLVIRDGVRVAAAGLAVGVVLAWVLTPAAATLLFHVPPHDPAVFVMVAAVLAGAALVASAIPGLRAGRVDPTTALREE